MTEFYCCNEMKENLQGLGKDYYKTMINIKFCPVCGKRFTLNSGF